VSERPPDSVHAFDATAIDGTQVPLAAFRGRVLLIVNVASRCGFTPQYEALEAMYRAYRDRGVTVLGFPCDQFGHQEPGSHEEIQAFCTAEYGVTFPLFAKIAVNGPTAHPLYVFLKSARKGLLGTTAIKWNFTKFLVDRDGRVVRRYGSSTPPAAIEPDIRQLL
jgi:glutathione peroxidase